MATFLPGESFTVNIDSDDTVSWSGEGSMSVTLSDGRKYTSRLTGNQTVGAFGKSAAIVFTADTVGSYSTNVIAGDHVLATTNPVTGGSDISLPSGTLSVPAGNVTVGSSSGSSGVAVIVNDPSKASINVTLIQAALNAGGKVVLSTPGIVWVDSTLLAYSNTELVIDANVTLKLTGGTARNLLVNNAFANPSFYGITSITASGNYVTATAAGHPFTVGQWIFVEGVGASGYNGTHRIQAVTSNTYSYYSPIAPSNLAPTVYAGPAMTGLVWAMQACPADTNITISGPGTIDWNGQNQTFPSNIDTYAVLLHRIYNPQVHNITGKNALKYMFCIAGSAGLRASNISMDTLSDGFNIEMPCFNASINGVSGISGDDFVAILCGDTQPKTFTVGDGFDIAVRDIESQGSSSLAAIKMAGCAPFIFDEVHGVNIGGTGRLSATIAIIDDLNMVGGSIGNVSFENINRYISGASTNGEILQMRMTGVGGRIKVRNATYNGTAGMGIRVDSVANIDELDVEINCNKAATGLPLVQVFGAVGKIKQKLDTGVNFAGYLGQTAAGAAVNAWFMSGYWRGTSGAKGLYQSAGTISRVYYSQVDASTIRAIFENETGASNSAEIYVDNVVLSSGLGLMLLRKGADVYLSNVNVSAISQQMIIDSNNTITVNAYFGSNVNCPSNLFANGSNNTINVKGQRRTLSQVYSATPTFTLSNNTINTFGPLTGNVTAITLLRIPPAGESVVFNMTQDATGGRTVTWPASVVFPTAWVDAITTTDANKKCTVGFISNGTQLVAQGANKWA